MIINENLVIKGDDLYLVPYRKEHVPVYHEWMKSPFLQEMTASEPLTLEEEYEMQKSWHQDQDKCTFILLCPSYTNLLGGNFSRGGMIGDVNLFLQSEKEAEIEIMIAEQDQRKKGKGEQALKLMMDFGLTKLKLKKFIAKIGLQNQSSLKLFEKLGFNRVSESKIFNEVTLEFQPQNPFYSQLVIESFD